MDTRYTLYTNGRFFVNGVQTLDTGDCFGELIRCTINSQLFKLEMDFDLLNASAKRRHTNR